MKAPKNLRPLGEQLREAREAEGLTAAAVARALGYEGKDTAIAGTIYRYEKEERRPTEETLLKLAVLYRRRLEYVKVETPEGRVVVVAEPAAK